MIKILKDLGKKLLYVIKFILALLMSIILIIFKLIIIPDIIFELILLIISNIFLKFKYEPISSCFVLNKKNNKIEQLINLEIYIETWRYDFYENSDLLRKKLQEINLKEELKNNKSIIEKKITCKTNTIIYFYVLKKYIGKKNLNVLTEKNIYIFQPCEKLTFMSPIVIWKHLILKKGRIKFIKKIYEFDMIKTYYFNVKNL